MTRGRLQFIKRSDLAAHPELRSNAFSAVMLESYDDLSELQRVAHLALLYDGEVQNGGHLQYFLNSRGEHLSETHSALLALGAQQHAAILEQAVTRWELSPYTEVETVEDHVAAAREEAFLDLDLTYYKLEPGLDSYLESFFEVHEDQFIAYV